MTRLQWKAVAIGMIVLMIQTGCAKRTLVPYDDLRVPSEIKMKMLNGKQAEMVALQKTPEKLIVRVPEGTKVSEINRAQIAEIYVYRSEYDENGGIITRAEIVQEKNHQNAYLYTLGGGVLSFGASLFLSSVIYRGMKDPEFKVINPISVGGGVLGTLILNWQGRKRDRMQAIERIKDQRKVAGEKILQEKHNKREQLQKQIEEMEKEKARVEAEKKRLEEKLNKEKPNP